MGFNLFSGAAPKSRLLGILSDMPAVELQRLSGNGMPLVVEDDWMFYCLGHTVRRDLRMAAVIQPATDDGWEAEMDI